MIDKATVDRIYSAADIVEVIGDFVTLKKKGVNYQACCPFHNEKTPSFVVSPSKGLFKCFGCGKGGNAVTFVMEHENMTYPEALKYVAKKYGIEVAEREQTPEEQRRNDDRESMMVVSSVRGRLLRPLAARHAGGPQRRDRLFPRARILGRDDPQVRTRLLSRPRATRSLGRRSPTATKSSSSSAPA